VVERDGGSEGGRVRDRSREERGEWKETRGRRNKGKRNGGREEGGLNNVLNMADQCFTPIIIS